MSGGSRLQAAAVVGFCDHPPNWIPRRPAPTCSSQSGDQLLGSQYKRKRQETLADIEELAPGQIQPFEMAGFNNENCLLFASYNNEKRCSSWLNRCRREWAS